LHGLIVGLQNVSAIDSASDLSAAQRKAPACRGQGTTTRPGGHHERVRQHRIGHLRLQACSKWSAVSGDDFRLARIDGGVRIAWRARGCSGEAILKRLHDDQDEDFDWRKSIVDLMKLLKLDSSLGARKQLAQELGYTGAVDGSAEMNVWLHKQVMTKLAESGGKVPDSLKA
jgi:hypothetical protein